MIEVALFAVALGHDQGEAAAGALEGSRESRRKGGQEDEKKADGLHGSRRNSAGLGDGVGKDRERGGDGTKERRNG